MDEYKKIVEINGVKMEIDMRLAKIATVDTFKVGDPVKILKKEYGDTYSSWYGIIAGFDGFMARPTIIVCYLENKYAEAKLCFAYINSETKDVEICHTDTADLGVERDDVLAKLDNEVVKKQEEIKELNRKKAYFLDHFQQYFGERIKQVV